MKKRERTIGFAVRVVIAAIFLAAVPAFSQSSSSVSWAGQVQCQLNDQDQTFVRQETQSWTLVGGPPISPTGIPTYNATWSVTGQGQLQRTQGAQTTNIQWTTNVAPQPTTISIFVRASDNRLIILPRHTQLRADNATTGARQAIVNGAAQQPTNISHAVWEWQFPHIEASPTDTTVTGSTQSQADAGDAELLHHYGGLPPSATCQWQFTKGDGAGTGGPVTQSQQGSNGNPTNTGATNTSPTSGNQNCPSPAEVQQSFDAMKADLASQYDKLIQASTDPTEIGSLTNQKQKMLANLNTQEQHDMQQANNGCSGTTATGGSQNQPGASNPGSSGSGSQQSTPPPTNVTAKAGDGSAVVSWSAPASNGSSIASYKVQVVPGGTAITASASPLTVSGLTNGTAYTFQVTAQNAQGVGSVPATSNSVTPQGLSAAPAPPTNVVAKTGNASALVSWTAPNNGTPIAAYTITSSSGGQPIQVNSGTSWNVTGLTNGTTYTFQVIALSTSGARSDPAMSNPVTPDGHPVSPRPPTNVTAAAGDASAVISWTAPAGTIASYAVQTLPNGPTTTTSTNQLTVPGLTNGTTYTFQVVATSDQGLASSPAVSNPVTPVSASPTGSSPVLVTKNPGIGTKTPSLALLVGASPSNNNGLQSVNGLQNGPVTLTGQGTHFVDGATTVSFQLVPSQPQSGATTATKGTTAIKLPAAAATFGAAPPLQVISVKVTPPLNAIATLNINPTTAAGTYSITVTTPTATGSEVVTLNNAFTVTTAPTLSGSLGGGKTTKKAPPASATYLVTITGLQCVRNTRDDLLNRDGKGDEIYAATFIRQYDRNTFQNTMQTEAQTRVYGDINGFPDRQPAGSLSPSGGITAGDFIPIGFIPGIKRTVPASPNLFPLTLYSGTLTDNADVLVLSPSVWESDGDTSIFSTWDQSQNALSQTIFTTAAVQNQYKKQVFGPLVLTATTGIAAGLPQAAGLAAASGIVDATLGLPPLQLLFAGTGKDRPIGLVESSNNVASTSEVLPNTTIVLTREIIENKVLKSNTWGGMVLDFKDTANFGLLDTPGEYTMYLQIERTAGTAGVPAQDNLPGANPDSTAGTSGQAPAGGADPTSTTAASGNSSNSVAAAPVNVTTTQAPSGTSSTPATTMPVGTAIQIPLTISTGKTGSTGTPSSTTPGSTTKPGTGLTDQVPTGAQTGTAACQHSAIMTQCGSACTLLSTDVNNCGACGNVCPTTPNTVASCNAGKCSSACAPGAVMCNGVCTNPQNDANNCGSCGNTCATGRICTQFNLQTGVDSGYQIDCDACKYPQFNVVCAANPKSVGVCKAASCLLGSGATCTDRSQCASNVCSPYDGITNQTYINKCN